MLEFLNVDIQFLRILWFFCHWIRKKYFPVQHNHYLKASRPILLLAEQFLVKNRWTWLWITKLTLKGAYSYFPMFCCLLYIEVHHPISLIPNFLSKMAPVVFILTAKIGTNIKEDLCLSSVQNTSLRRKKKKLFGLLLIALIILKLKLR